MIRDGEMAGEGNDEQDASTRHPFRRRAVCRVQALRPAGVAPVLADEAGHVVFKVEGANVITGLTIQATLERKSTDDLAAVAVSTTHGLTWKEVWKNDKTGETQATVKLVEPVNGAYEVLVRVTLKGAAFLKSIAFETLTMLNSKTQPQLLLGRNTVYVGVGDPTESIVLWPDLQGKRYKPYVVEERNVATKDKHPGYMGAMHAARPNEDAYVVFRIDAPRDITRVTYGGRLYNRAPKSHIDLLHSFDGGKTWVRSYSLTDTKPPWDVIHYETIDRVPPGTRSVLLEYLWNSSAAGTNACSLYAVRMEANHRPADAAFRPLEVIFRWQERQEDYSLVKRSHIQQVEKVPFRYTINVGGADHPVVDSLEVRLRGPVADAMSGYLDGKDPGGEKFMHRWVTVGTNLAAGKPYTVSVPSLSSWGAGDPEGKKLTDGIVGPPYAGGIAPRYALCWNKGSQPVVTVDLGQPQICGAFRIQIGAGWPWWDALKGEVKDKVEVLTSPDGRDYASQGFFDSIRYEPFDLRLTLPDEPVATPPARQGGARPENATAGARLVPYRHPQPESHPPR